MIRISGFILGVVLVVTAFLLVFKPEDAKRPGIRVTSVPMEAIKEQVKPWLNTGKAENSDSRMSAASTEPVESAGDLPEDNEDTGMADGQAPPEEEATLQAGVVGHDKVLTTPEPDDVYKEAGAEHTTHLFWSPFRSQWAAQGFARSLAVATSVPVEVIDEGPGKYRVGFSYRDEMERRDRIDQIESITGLQLE